MCPLSPLSLSLLSGAQRAHKQTGTNRTRRTHEESKYFLFKMGESQPPLHLHQYTAETCERKEKRRESPLHVSQCVSVLYFFLFLILLHSLITVTCASCLISWCSELLDSLSLINIFLLFSLSYLFSSRAEVFLFQQCRAKNASIVICASEWVSGEGHSWPINLPPPSQVHTHTHTHRKDTGRIQCTLRRGRESEVSRMKRGRGREKQAQAQKERKRREIASFGTTSRSVTFTVT